MTLGLFGITIPNWGKALSNLIQISEAASLALHSMAFLANRNGGQMAVSELAGLTGSSENHLAKVFQRLSKAGLVRGTRGPSGGYLLVKPPQDVTLMEVFEAIEGPAGPGPCPCSRGYCGFKTCMFQGIFAQATHLIRDYLENKTLDAYLEGVPDRII